MSDTNLLLIFFTGLTSGGLSCLAVQGGLLTSLLSKKEHQLEDQLTKQNNLAPISIFLLSKLFTHTLFGALLGLLGGAISLSPITKGYLQIAIAVYLFGVAGATLDLHPLFRYFILTPPKFLVRLLKKQTQADHIFAPALLGAFTIFLPCATTQAMEVVALGTGNPLLAATIMFAFVLGTSPTFFVFGFLLSKLSGLANQWFYRFVGALLFIIAFLTLNAGLTLAGSAYTFDNFYQAATQKAPTYPLAKIENDFQTATITVTNAGYSPKVITLKKGLKARITLTAQNVQSCARAFTIPEINFEKLLPVNGATIVEFTPNKTGHLAFSCSMGMYSGSFNVIN